MGKIKCDNCNQILESLYRHQFVQCKCENESFVDGGISYTKIGGKDLSKISIWMEDEQKFINNQQLNNLNKSKEIFNQLKNILGIK
jgi:hypothetical protein